MKNRIIKENEINKIIQNCKPREQAFFTVMRQSGLKPHVLKQLKIKDIERILESETPAPCLIDTRYEKLPAFIGEEGIQYLKKYLKIRSRKEKLTPESLSFTAKNNPNKGIDTKDASRTFREVARRLEISQKVKKGERSDIIMLSLVKFYRTNAKNYLNEIKNNPSEDLEILRNLYKENAMPSLEIETKKTISIYKLQQYNKQIKEMRQTITKDDEYISSILTLLYNNKGDYETGENIELGNYFIELWKETAEEQRQNLKESWTDITRLLPYKDILEELTKTLERIAKPYKGLKSTQKNKQPK